MLVASDCALQRRDGYFHFESLFATAIDDAAQRCNVGEIAAPSDGDMLQPWDEIVSRIEIHPTVAGDE